VIRHAIFRGRVQGVGFRYTAASTARQHPVQGYVRNLPDGSVELRAEGTRADLQSFVSAIQQEMAGYIDDTKLNEQTATGEFRDFSIR
jgi:acylphosphatase